MKPLKEIIRYAFIGLVYASACIVSWILGTLIVSFFPAVGYFEGYWLSIGIAILVMIIFTFAVIVAYNKKPTLN